MKLHAFRERFGGLIALVTLLLLACFASFSIIQNIKINQEYQVGSQYLDSLQKHTPSLTQENLSSVLESTKAYQQALQSLWSEFKPHPIDTTLTPQQFQDRLRSTVSDIAKSAAEAKVQLPDAFYLGFDSYQSRLPSNEAAPQLGQELEAISTLIHQLIDLQVTTINKVIRHPLPIETTTADSSTEASAKSEAQAKENLSQHSSLRKFPVDISFTADENRLRQVFNWLITPPQFVLIRALRIRNSSPEGPIHESPNDFPPPSAPPAPVIIQAKNGPSSEIRSAPPPQLRILLGREKVTADLQLEFVEVLPLTNSN